MALGGRQMLTPEWAFWHRDAVAGSMMCRVELFNVNGADLTAWSPADGFGDKPTDTETLVYRGIARVQPNKDWRARKQKFETEQVVEHAYRIQLPFKGNELAGGVLPPHIGTEDRVRIIEVSSLRGVLVDPLIMNYAFVVRNSQGGSNYWVRTLLCDVVLDG